MKKIYLTFLPMLMTILALGQSDITICHTPATEKFALFASNKSFNSEHQMPRVYTHVSQAGGKMVTFDCPDGTKGNGYVVMATQKTDNWIFVFQEWWGLNDNIKKWADDLHVAVGNVNVIALDMYDGKLATDRENAGKYMQAFKQERGDAIVKGALDYAGKRAKVGTVGWCFGGGQSLQAALTAGKQTVGCVMYYGMPEEDVNRLKNLKSDVLNIWATKDQWINKDVMDKFEKNMKEAGKKLTISAYDAEHGFANPSNAIFDEKAYQDARAKTVAYFKSKF